MNPFIVEESQERYQERVNAAEYWRMAKTAQATGPGRYNRLRSFIGDHLIAWGTWLKAYAAPAQVHR